MKRTSFLNLLRHDLINGILFQWKKFVPLFVIVVMICLNFHQDYLFYLSKDNQMILSFGDYWFNLMKGMPIFNPENSIEQLDFLWISLQLYLAFLISLYPTKDLSGYGQNILLRSQSKKSWWLSKCMWAISVTVFFYLIVIISIVFVCIFIGNLSLIPHSQVQSEINHFLIQDISHFNLVIQAIIVPMGVSIFLTSIEMLLILLFGNIVGLLSTIGALLLPIFYDGSYIFTGYLMLMRNERLVNSFEANEFTVLHLYVLIIFVILSIIIGVVYFNQKDLLMKKG
jgi:hypothetical protein